MGRTLSSLKGLEAFEAAARHLSFMLAADELGVTPAAVSQRIGSLEKTLGVTVFVRKTRSIELTPAGASALRSLTEGFDCLERGYEELSGGRISNSVTVSVTPCFATRWLIPRLARFHSIHPEISVRLDTTYRLTDFRAQNVDIAIRNGAGNYPGLICEQLIHDHALVVCHPNLLNDAGNIRRGQWSGTMPLLHIDWNMETYAAPTWEKWCAFNGIENLDVSDGIRFTLEDLAVRAALTGLGYALVTRAFVEDELATGQLVPATPPGMNMPTTFHHYVVHPKPPANLSQPARAFRNWLFGEVRDH